MKYAITILLFSINAFAKNFELKNSSIEYQVKYTFKTATGKSTEAKGKGGCDDNGKCHFLVAAPIKSFDSGDGNRDAKMLLVTKATQNPMVIADLIFEYPKSVKDGSLKANIKLNFSGKEKTYNDIPIHVTSEAGNVDARFELKILLSDFSVERPSLLMIQIEDEVPVTISGTWWSTNPT